MNNGCVFLIYCAYTEPLFTLHFHKGKLLKIKQKFHAYKNFSYINFTVLRFKRAKISCVCVWNNRILFTTFFIQFWHYIWTQVTWQIPLRAMIHFHIKIIKYHYTLKWTEPYANREVSLVTFSIKKENPKKNRIHLLNLEQNQLCIECEFVLIIP